MAALRDLFDSLGYGHVETYIQSGNVVFDAPARDARALSDAIELAILGEFGFGVDVVVRSAAELAAIVAGNPFVPHVTDAKALHVAFPRDPIQGSRTVDRSIAPGEASVGSGVIYLHAPGGFGRSKLTDAFLKRLAGSLVTTRNWNTVTKLAELVDR
jgi:uncharacterized protein (DUF1697 family)